MRVSGTARPTLYACPPDRGQQAMDPISILPSYTGTVAEDVLRAYRQ